MFPVLQKYKIDMQQIQFLTENLIMSIRFLLTDLLLIFWSSSSVHLVNSVLFISHVIWQFIVHCLVPVIVLRFVVHNTWLLRDRW